MCCACDCACRRCGRRHVCARVRGCKYIGMHGLDICMYLCTPLKCMCARVCYDAADAHTCGRVCVSMTRLCTACVRVRRPLFMRPRAPTMRPLPLHARVCMSAGIYIANAHVMYIIYVYVYRCKVRVCKWVRMCVLAYARDRVRALTMRECAACVRVRHAHFVEPSMDTHRYSI
jgi:hypothetical protein